MGATLPYFGQESGTEDVVPFASATVDVLMSVFACFLARSQDRSTDLKSAYRCLAVCKSWSQVVRSPALWASVRVSSYGDDGCDEIGQSIAFDVKSLAALTSLMQHSHRLEFFFSRWSDELLATVLGIALQAGSNLRALGLQSIRFLQLPTSIASLGDVCDGLTEFSMERSRCKDMSELPQLEGLLGKWSKLEKLSLRFLPFSKSTTQLLPSLLDLSLTVDSSHCSPEAVAAISSCSKLRRFSFIAAPRICSHVHIFGEALVAVLKNCLSLESLALGKIRVDEELFLQISRSIASQLRVLRLDNCKWNHVPGAMLHGMGALQDLETNNCLHVTDQDLVGLSAAPQRCLRRLAVRNVHGSDVTDEGLLTTACAYPEIEDLCITGDTNSLGVDAVTDRFLEALLSQDVLPRLQKLNLRGFYSVTTGAYFKLCSARPQLNFQWAGLGQHVHM